MTSKIVKKSTKNGTENYNHRPNTTSPSEPTEQVSTNSLDDAIVKPKLSKKAKSQAAGSDGDSVTDASGVPCDPRAADSAGSDGDEACAPPAEPALPVGSALTVR